MEAEIEVKAGDTYIFRKSGSPVRAIAPDSDYKGQPCWTVERTGGEAAGKQMTVTAQSLELDTSAS